MQEIPGNGTPYSEEESDEPDERPMRVLRDISGYNAVLLPTLQSLILQEPSSLPYALKLHDTDLNNLASFSGFGVQGGLMAVGKEVSGQYFPLLQC